MDICDPPRTRLATEVSVSWLFTIALPKLLAIYKAICSLVAQNTSAKTLLGKAASSDPVKPNLSSLRPINP